MESKNRNVWIIVVIAVVVLGCLAVLVTAVVAGFFVARTRRTAEGEWGVTTGQASRLEQTFSVSDAPRLEIDNFAGSINVRAGAGGVIRVVATKKSISQANLARIDVQITEQRDGLLIKTERSPGLGSASVDLEITAPADTRLSAQTAAGSMEVEGLAGMVQVDTNAGSITLVDVMGQIEARTNAGSIQVRGAAGPVDLYTSAGSIRYQGTPVGECRLESAAGSIDIVPDEDPNVEVDLRSDAGSVTVDYAVRGQVSRTRVQGVIGDGSRGSIYAHASAGSIRLLRR